MKRIVHLGLVGAILATMVVAVLPVFEPRPVMAMTGSGTEADPYMVYNITDLQAINDVLDGTRYSRPWDDNFGLADQSGTWTVYPYTTGNGDGIFWDKLAEVTSDSDTTYIQAESDNAYCLLVYEGTPLSLPDYATNIVVKIHARVRNTAAGTSYVQGMVRDVTTDYLIGSNTAISSQSYALKTWTMNNPPWRSWDEWTVADAYLAGFGVGVKVSDANPNLRITQLYIEVTFTAAAYFELANDIDASDTVTWNGGAGFVPLGPFGGTFDGQGYTISGLHVNRPATDYIGLFTETEGSTILDLTLTTANITGRDYVGGLVGMIGGEPHPCTISNVSVSGEVNGRHYVGGLIGFSYSSQLSDCHTDCTITLTGREGGGMAGTLYGEGSAVWTRCSAAGAITGAGDLGGFIGRMDEGQVSQSYSLVTVNGDTWMPVGGFIGNFEAGQVTDCYARGDVTNADTGDTGGFMGWAGSDDYPNDVIQDCYSTGNVTGAGSYVGGLFGDMAEPDSPTVTACFWDTETSGQATSGGGTGKTTAELKNIFTFTNAGWDIGVTELGYLNDGYAFLSWQVGNSPTWVMGYITQDINQVVHFQPNTIILGTTLPNRAGGGVYPNGTFSWGANPAGIEIRLDGFLQPEDVYRFEPIMPGGWDIIEPEPVGMTGDVDLGKLAKNPLRPLVQVLSEGAGFTERLAWLCLAIFILIVIMIAVQLRTDHMVFTALSGFAVSFLFYSIGVWGLWVPILLAFGLVASIVYERMPTL